jgi:aminopeptidase N
MEELRQLVGEEAFFAFLADYRQRYMYKLASGAGFFETLRAHTAVDLGPLVEKYFKAAP